MNPSSSQIHDVLRDARKAIKANPRDETLHGMLADLYERLGRFQEAISHLGFLYGCMSPASEELCTRYSYALLRSQSLVKACEVVTQGLVMYPESPSLLRNRIMACLMARQWEEARDACMRLSSVDLQEEYAVGLAGTLKLLATDLREGWDDYAKRPHDKAIAGLFGAIPRWKGEPLEGKRIALWSEQGIGDVVMFLGFLPWITAKITDISVVVTTRLAPLVSRSFPSVEVVCEDGIRSLPERCDCHAPLGDLFQYAFGDYVPAMNRPYLYPDKRRTQELRDRYCDHARTQGRNRIVGLSWHTTNPFVGFMRNVTLEELHPILTIPGVQFVSLQYGDHAEEITESNRHSGNALFVDPAIDAFNDLDGLAAQMAALDGVVTIDNATVHLAGALGVPTTLLLSAVPDWRWGLHGNECRWYRSVYLERQEALSKWKPVIKRVRERLSGGKP